MVYEIRFSDDVQKQLPVSHSELEQQIRGALRSLDDEHLSQTTTPLGFGRYALDLTSEEGSLTLLLQTPEGEDVLLVAGAFRRVPPRPRPTREQALEVVRAGIGKRPDLPSGMEYVKQVKKIWHGLLPND